MLNDIKEKFKGTYILLIINIIIFLLMTITGGSTNTYNLIRFGAISPSLIKAGGFYRLFTAMFIHIGFIHLLMNMAFLIQIGPILESIYKTKNFVKIYLLSGIMGNLFVFALGKSNVISAGASTSLYGLLGVMIGFLFFHKDNNKLIAFGTATIPTIFINLLYTFITPGISILGHLGGFIGGFLLSGIIPINGIYKENKIKDYSVKAIFIILSIALFIIGYIF